MGLTTRPSKNIDLTKIDEIQSEFFDKNLSDEKENSKLEDSPKSKDKNTSIENSGDESNLKSANQPEKSNSSKIKTGNTKKRN